MGITGYIPSYVSLGKDDRRGDGLILHSDTGYTLIVDGFDGSSPTAKMITWLKDRKITDLYLLLTHPHYDHYSGLRMIMRNGGFKIKRFYCYDPETIRHGIGSSANGKSVKEDYDNLKSIISQAKGCGAEVVYLKKDDSVTLGDIRFKVWREQPTHFTDLDDGNAYAFTNNGSLCTYFQDFHFLTTGDGPESLKDAISYFGGKISFLKIPHHGNSCSASNAKAARGAGCTLAYETNVEAKGPGTTDFTAYGARRLVEQGIKVLMENTDIWMLVSDGLLRVVQGSSTWRFEIPYREGEWKKENGKTYYYKGGKAVTGSQQIEGKWYFFGTDGAMQKGLVQRGKDYYWYDCQTGELRKSVWISDGKVWRFYDEWGRAVTGWHKDSSGQWCFLDPATHGGKIVDDWYYDKYQKAWYRLDKKGWMIKTQTVTIDGKAYSFDGYGRLLDNSGRIAQAIEDGVRKEKELPSKAVDVSEFNPENIDWTKVREAGYGAILRLGIRGSIFGTSGCGQIRYDKHYNKYLEGALRAGVQVGVYFFPTSINEAEAKEEADWIISNVKNLNLAFPVYLDSEMVNGGKGRADGLSKADRTRYLKIITDRLTAAGIPCGIYASTSWFGSKLDMAQFPEDVRKNTWVAQYNSSCTYSGPYSLWQYTSKGSVPGINGNVDVSKRVGGEHKDTGKYPRGHIVSLAQSLVGTQEGTAGHRSIIDAYNARKPLPRGYAVKYTDAWCATFCSYLAIKCGYTDIIPVECGCPQWTTLAKNMGIWQESDNYTPRPGDFVLYDWQDSGSGDNTGTPDHIGIVEKVVGNVIHVIEGNKNDAVERREIGINGRYIRGFVLPKYSD